MGLDRHGGGSVYKGSTVAYLSKAINKGVFETVKIGSKNVPRIDQEKETDCGPACVGLVLRMTGYKDADSYTPDVLRGASQASSGRGYRPSARDAVGSGVSALQTNLAACMQEFAQHRGLAYDDNGTYSDNIESTLRDKYGFKKAKSDMDAGIKQSIRGATLAKPMIVNVVWENNAGAHWVVACGYDSAMFGHGSYLFSDPYYGAGWLQIPRENVGGNKQPSYRPTAQARGHLSGWYISV